MKKEMLINVLQPEECRIAILEDGVLEELYVERTSHESYVGNIYKGRIVNIEPSIQAAFVDFGVGRNGFLHVSDVEPAYYRHLEARRSGGNRPNGDRDREQGRDRGRGRDRDRGRGRPRPVEDIQRELVEPIERATPPQVPFESAVEEQPETEPHSFAAGLDLPPENPSNESGSSHNAEPSGSETRTEKKHERIPVYGFRGASHRRR